jgi:predicted TIM-barrel fold metal-dependent hydrolase
MPTLPFFDCNCMIGTRMHRHRVSPETLQDFLDDFAYYDIMGALVYHAAAKEYAPNYGNRLLLQEIGDDPRLMPQWVVLPHHTSEMAPPAELVAEMLSLGVRAARLFPQAHGTGIGEAVCGALFEELQAHRVPLFIERSELEILDAVALAKRYSELPIVLCGVSWNEDRLIFAAFGDVPNLRLDTWSYQNHRGYEAFIQRFGSERLLFSTNLPFRSPGAARMMTCYENISEQDRRNIAGLNLLRLLGNVQGTEARPLPEFEPPPEHPEDDPIVAAVRAGEPLRDEFVLDCHNHLGHPGSQGIDQCSFPHNDADGLVGTMDRLGVDIACPSSWAGITYAGPDANDHTLDAAARHPGRLLPYGCLNPSYPELFRAEFERIFLTNRVMGYKPAPFRQAVHLSDPVHEPVYRWAAERGAPVLCDERGGTPEELLKVAPKHPDVPFILAHCGQSYDFAERAVAAAKQCPNIHAEITYTLICYGIIEYLVEELGAERVLYGTDCVMRDAAPQLGWVAWAKIPLEAKRRVLGVNFADILKLPEQRRRPIAPA